jgi:two-component system chemotaxis response regulator CheV
MDNVNAVTRLAENNEVQLMVFRTGNDEDAPYYAINVFKTREAIESKKHFLTQIPASHPLLEGTISLRGSLVPIIDLPAWLNAPLTREEKELSKILICDFNGIMIGLRITMAHKIIKKSWADLHSPDGYALSDDAKVVNDTRLEDGSICLVLDYEKLLSEVIPEAMVDTEITYQVKPANIPDTLKNGMVLIAEDSRTAQKALTRIFDKVGVPMQLFNNGRLLLDYIDSLPDPASSISAIVTDLEMPEVSGFRVVMTLKANDSTKHIPVIVNSSMTGTSNKRDAEKLGADGFIDKTKSDKIIPLIIGLLEEKA